MKGILTLIFAFLLAGMIHAQSDSTYYSFLKMRDGTPIAGKVIASDATTITIVDFNIGQLTLNKTQILKETDITVNSSYCFTYFSGQEYCGKIVSSDSLITVRTESVGDIKIDPRKVKEVRDIGDVNSSTGQTWEANRTPFKYFITPSAIPMKRGEKYFQNTELDLNNMDFGITDNFSAGIGIVLPIFIAGNCKLSYKLADNFYAGAGIAGGGSVLFGTGFGVAAGYGIATVGDEEDNFSVLAGWGLGSWSRYGSSNGINPNPTFGIHGMVRLGRKLTLVTENYAITNQRTVSHYAGPPSYTYYYTYETVYTTVVSAGVRVMVPKGVFEAGIIYLPQVDVWNGFGFAIPLIDYGINF